MKKDKKSNIYKSKMTIATLGNKAALDVIDYTSEKPLCVTDLYIKARREQAEMSLILRGMKSIGAVTDKRDGKFIYYEPNFKRIKAIEKFMLKLIEHSPTIQKTVLYNSPYDASYDILQTMWRFEVILNFLHKAVKPHKVSSIYSRLKIEESICSQALAGLRRIGIVTVQQNGKERLYTLNREMYSKIINTVNEFVNDKHPAE